MENNCSHFPEYDTSLANVENNFEDPCFATYFNSGFSIDSFLEMEESEASYYPKWFEITAQIIYSLIFLIGLSGNGAIVFVYFRSPKIHTLTNFLVLNLAIADICFLIGLPLLISTSVFGEWHFGVLLCKAYFMTTGIQDITTSIFIVGIVLDRYLASYCQSVKAEKGRNRFLTKVLVAVFSWSMSIGMLSPIILYSNTLIVNEKIHCNVFWPESESGTGDEIIFIIYTMLLGFVFPFILSCVFVVLTVIRRKSHYLIQDISTNQQHERKLNNLKFILTLFTVHFAFRAPYWATQLAILWVGHESYLMSWFLTLFISFVCLSYLPSTLNPFIYGLLSEDFNRAIKNVLGRNQKSTVIFKSPHECELILDPTT